MQANTSGGAIWQTDIQFDYLDTPHLDLIIRLIYGLGPFNWICKHLGNINCNVRTE